MFNNTHYVVSDWDEKLLSPKILVNRLKRCIFNLQEIDEKGQLDVANNVRDLFCKWEEVANSRFAKRDFETYGLANRERGKDASV